MKKLFKLIAVALSVMTVCSFVGCSKPQTFTKLEMSIELNSSFAEKTLISQTAYYESRTMIVCALREDFSLAEGVKDWTLEDYGNACVSVNGLSNVEVSVAENGEYSYFTYEKELNSVEYTYFATCHKTDSAFWLIQFATFTKDFEKSKSTIDKYIASIKFDAQA